MVLFLGTFEDTGQPGEICLKEPVLIKRHVGIFVETISKMEE